MFRLLYTVLVGLLFHTLDAQVEVGVAGEQLVHLACLAYALLFLKGFKLLERQSHRARVLSVRFEELVSVIVSFFFLLLRVGGSGKAFTEGTELGVGKGGGNIARRCHGVLKSRGEQRLLEGLLGVLLCNVAHFVA